MCMDFWATPQLQYMASNYHKRWKRTRIRAISNYSWVIMAVVLWLHHHYLALTPVTQIGMNKLRRNVILALNRNPTQSFSHNDFDMLANQEITTQNKYSVVGHYFPLLFYFLVLKMFLFLLLKKTCFFVIQMASLGTKAYCICHIQCLGNCVLLVYCNVIYL